MMWVDVSPSLCHKETCVLSCLSNFVERRFSTPYCANTQREQAAECRPQQFPRERRKKSSGYADHLSMLGWGRAVYPR